MNTATKTHSTHRVWFSDSEPRPDSDNAVEVAVVWPRKGDKQGGILRWNLLPEILGLGTWRLLNNFLIEQAAQTLKTYAISFSQTLDETGKLGRAVKVAAVDKSGFIHWSIAPEKLTNGVLFVLNESAIETEDDTSELSSERAQVRFKSQQGTDS